jgi:hypothetical protein
MRHRLHVVPWLRLLGGLLFKDWLAITIGRDVWAWRPLDPAELAHELAHAAQWRRYGALFAVLYLVASFKVWRRGGRWYQDNPFEIDAREAADAVRGPR